MKDYKGQGLPQIIRSTNKNSELIGKVINFKDFETPFMLTDLSVIKRNCRTFKAAMPHVKLYYAIKAFSSPEIVTAISDEVDGFDVASLKEITDLLRLGVSAEKLNFSNPVKSTNSIKRAFELGVRKFAFQSLSELAKLQVNAPGALVYARLMLEDSVSFVPLSGKFGCDPDEAVKLLMYAKRVGLRPIGLTFHVGSQLLDHSAWRDAIGLANSILTEARAKGIKATEINIGGGFPAKYFQDDPDIETVATYVNDALDHNASVTYAAEPGRYIVANSSVIVSKVIGVERRNGQNWLFIDTGLFQSFLGTLRYDYFPYQPISLSHEWHKRDAKPKIIPYVLTGPTCDSQDIISSTVFLPSDIALDDLLVFPNTGAYTTVYGSNFNGFSVPANYFI